MFGLPPGCSIVEIDALRVEETPLTTYATDLYREEMVARLAHTLDDLKCVCIAVAELASHGHPNAAPWAVRDWLEAFEREMAPWYVTDLMRCIE